MAIGVKTVERPESGASYLRATLKGMALTFKHLVKPVTAEDLLQRVRAVLGG